MKVIKPGHLYELDSLEHTVQQRLQFIEKELDVAVDNKLITVNDGTTNEEVLEMLIDRMKHLNKKMPCKESHQAITKLEEALLWIESRTSKRINLGINSTNISH